MADELEIDINGIESVTRKIYQFSNRLGDRVTRLALRSGANYVLKRVRLAAPKKTGRLRRAIVVKNSRINTRRRTGKVGVYITIKPGKNRKDPKGAWYGKFVEHGHAKRRSKSTGSNAQKVPGQYFIKNTFNQTKISAVRLIIKNIETGGRALVDKF